MEGLSNYLLSKIQELRQETDVFPLAYSKKHLCLFRVRIHEGVIIIDFGRETLSYSIGLR
jgi:hypothetical protein